MKVEPRHDVFLRGRFYLENYYFWLRIEYKQKLNMEVDMKKVLPWVITCIYLIVWWVANENFLVYGLGGYHCLFIFAFVPLIAISCSFSRYLNVFKKKRLSYSRISSKSLLLGLICSMH